MVARLAPNLAVNQTIWLFISVVVMIVVLAVIRPFDALARYKYPLVFSASYFFANLLLADRYGASFLISASSPSSLRSLVKIHTPSPGI